MRSMRDFRRKEECFQAVTWQTFYDHTKEEVYFYDFFSKQRKSTLNRKTENLRLTYVAIAEASMIEVFEALAIIAR